MRRRSLAIAVGAALVFAGAAAPGQMQQAQAQQDVAPPNAPPPRYSFNPVDNGFLRFDTVSGQVTICSQHAVGWACQAVPEDRAALETEIARLQDEVASLKVETTRLKSEIASLRAPPPPPRPPADLSPPAKKDGATIKLPTHEDIEYARAVIEKAWRRLVDMIADFQKDMMKKG